MVADVSVDCSSEEYARVTRWAWAAVGIYPIGMLLLTLLLLLRAREAILSGVVTPFSRATEFLHREYKTTFFWWELAEMMRRFILVGLLVVYEPGTMMQLVAGTSFCVGYFAIQIQTAPYRSHEDGYIAMSASVSLVSFMVLCLVFKNIELFESKEIADRLSIEQSRDFSAVSGAYTAIAVVTLLLTLVLSGLIFLAQRARRASRLPSTDASATETRTSSWRSSRSAMITTTSSSPTRGSLRRTRCA